MRHRNNTFLTAGAADSDDNSDPEEGGIQAAHPDERSSKHASFHIESSSDWRNLLTSIAQSLLEGKAWWVQCCTISVAALLTYSYNNISAHGTGTTNVQIAVMTVITLVGASPFLPTHLTTAAIGAFVGGHNMIGAIGLVNFGPNDTIHFGIAYLWILAFSWLVGLIWCFCITKFRILDGYAGRLGTTTFIGTNVMTVLVWGPVGVVDWNRYYFGFVHLVHVAEEDSAPVSLAQAWKWTEEAELAIGYVLAVVWLALVAGATRILHHRYIQQCQQSSSSSAQPAPLNNVLVPVLWALLSMLVVNATQYQHAAGLYNGFAVGAYVAMASLQKISTIPKFATVGLVAAAWGLALTPFFVGFAGKSGFTAMMGHVTHSLVETHLLARSRRRQQQSQSQQQGPPQVQSSQQIEQPQKQPQSPSRKPKQKQVYYTKQQRRQQQRLQHLQQQERQPITQQQLQKSPPLHHRAWSALPPREGDAAWQHPLNSSTATTG